LLPSGLLRARVSRGRIFPIYANLDSGTLSLVGRIVETFRNSSGRRKGDLIRKLKAFEDEGFDYRLVRGMAALLERMCIFEAESPIDPKEARMMVFEEASRTKAVSMEERKKVIDGVASRLGINGKTLEKVLYSDLDDELILRSFNPISPEALIKYYNLSLTQTLLLRSLRMVFTASGNWKSIFRAMKRLGLMYSIEQKVGGYEVYVDGPMSIFKMTDRYGASLAKLLPKIVATESWFAKADVLAKRKNRIYVFELFSKEAKGIMEDVFGEGISDEQYDSTVEERFANSFAACGSGWTLRREPEPILAGRSVLIPDFSFEKRNMKIYLEIVGFWTHDYLEKKIRKLSSIVSEDLIVAVDESLACSKLQKLKGRIIYYRKDVPLRPILEYLKQREEESIEAEAQLLMMKQMRLEGDIVSVEDIARKYGLSTEAVDKAVQSIDFDGYRRIGKYQVSNAKLAEIEGKISSLENLADALKVIEACGINDPFEVLKALGYAVVWEGLNVEKGKIRKARSQSLDDA